MPYPSAVHVDIESIKKQFEQFDLDINKLETGDPVANLLKLQKDISWNLSQNIYETTGEVQRLNKYLEYVIEHGTTGSGATNSEETLVKGIFSKLYSVNKQVEEIQLQIKNKLKASGHNLSASDTFEIQYLVTQMTVLMDLASKMGGKASDALQVLFRNQ